MQIFFAGQTVAPAEGCGAIAASKGAFRTPSRRAAPCGRPTVAHHTTSVRRMHVAPGSHTRISALRPSEAMRASCLRFIEP